MKEPNKKSIPGFIPELIGFINVIITKKTTEPNSYIKGKTEDEKDKGKREKNHNFSFFLFIEVNFLRNYSFST